MHNNTPPQKQCRKRGYISGSFTGLRIISIMRDIKKETPGVNQGKGMLYCYV